MTITVTPFAAGCGADIGGVDISRPLAAEDRDAIRAAWLGHLVLRFRSQRLSVRLARRGGNRYRQAQALSDLAAAYHAAGRPYRAVSAARQAAMISARLG